MDYVMVARWRPREGETEKIETILRELATAIRREPGNVQFFTGLRAVVRAALFCLAVLLLFEYDRVRRFELGLRIAISFGFCGITCRHHRSPTSAIKPAGQDPYRPERSHYRSVWAAKPVLSG
jgi:hypothetical protein